MGKTISIVCLSVVLLLSGCGKGQGGIEDSADQVEELGVNDVKVEEDKESIKVGVEGGGQIEVVKEGGRRLELPTDYPTSILPLYSDEFIASVQKNPDGTYAIVGMTNDSVEEVKVFYQTQLVETSVVTTQQDEGFFMMMGDKDGSTYTVMVEVDDDEESGFQTLYILSVAEGQPLLVESSEDTMAEEKTSPPSKPTDLVVPEGQSMPESYPEDLMPIYPTGNVEASILSEGMIGIMTEDIYDDVIVYYKDILSGGSDFVEMSMPPAAMLSGSLGGYSFQVMVGPNEGQEEEGFQTLIQIIYQ